MFIIQEEFIRKIYDIIGEFKIEDYNSELNIIIENKPTKEKLKKLYELFFENINVYIAIKTNYDDILSLSEFHKEYIKTLRRKNR